MSITLAVDSADSSPAIVDMAAAKIAAISSPMSPTGRWVTTNVGNT